MHRFMQTALTCFIIADISYYSLDQNALLIMSLDLFHDPAETVKQVTAFVLCSHAFFVYCSLII